jgi:hypothetical protein
MVVSLSATFQSPCIHTHRTGEVTDSFYLYGTNQTAFQDVWTGFKNSYLTYLYYCDTA